MKKIVTSFIRAGALLLVLCITCGPLFAADGATDKQMFRKGAKLWGHYCNYCHKARPGTDFDRIQWKTLMFHMRVRANLPAQDAEAILVYLRSTH